MFMFENGPHSHLHFAGILCDKNKDLHARVADPKKSDLCVNDEGDPENVQVLCKQLFEHNEFKDFASTVKPPYMWHDSISGTHFPEPSKLLL